VVDYSLIDDRVVVPDLKSMSSPFHRLVPEYRGRVYRNRPDNQQLLSRSMGLGIGELRERLPQPMTGSMRCALLRFIDTSCSRALVGTLVTRPNESETGYQTD
jgi:hypothetical protein